MQKYEQIYALLNIFIVGISPKAISFYRRGFENIKRNMENIKIFSINIENIKRNKLRVV